MQRKVQLAVLVAALFTFPWASSLSANQLSLDATHTLTCTVTYQDGTSVPLSSADLYAETTSQLRIQSSPSSFGTIIENNDSGLIFQKNVSADTTINATLPSAQWFKTTSASLSYNGVDYLYPNSASDGFWPATVRWTI